MKQLADLYGVRLDDFLLTPAQREADECPPERIQSGARPQTSVKRQNRLIIAAMAALLVWLIATVAFVILDTFCPQLQYGSFLFLYAAPITAVVCLVFNSIWFNPRWNYAIVSVLVWSVLGSVFLTFYEHKIWKVFLIGIPAQLIIILWSRLRKHPEQPAPNPDDLRREP